jgi:predicted dehydrogenase
VSTPGKNIGLGVVGTGLGSSILRINQIPDSRLQVRGLYETDPARLHQRYEVGKSLRSLADEFSVGFIAEDYHDLLAHPDIDCIAVFSPCPAHHEQVVAALDAGKHVIVTKPMAVSLDEAREIVDAVDRTGLKLLVAQSMRWNSMFLAIRELFDTGELGEVRLAESYYVHDMRPVFDASPWRYEMPQDFMYGGVCHPVDLLRWFLGEVDEVFAYGNHGGLDTRYPADKENNFVISLKYRSGAIARVLGAFDLVHPPSLWARPFHGVGLALYGTRASVFNDRIVREYYGTGQPREEAIEPKGGQLGHAEEVLGFLQHFEECIVNDTKPLVDARDGAQIVAICSACWESIRTGLPVKVTREFDRVEIG